MGRESQSARFSRGRRGEENMRIRVARKEEMSPVSHFATSSHACFCIPAGVGCDRDCSITTDGGSSPVSPTRAGSSGFPNEGDRAPF
jgi:hypothetical protein